MRKFTAFLTFAIIFSFVSCDTTSHYTLKISVDREPILTVLNQTGYPIVLTAPVNQSIAHGAGTQHQPADTSRSIDITYRIEQIEFTEQVAMNNADATVTLTRRPPTITVINQTGYSVELYPPFQRMMNIGESVNFLPPALNQNIDVIYRIGLMGFTEQVNMGNQDITLTLTRRPPTLTVVNNVGATINTIFMRTPGAPTWTGGNIVIRGGIVHLAAAGQAQATDISGSIVNRDSMQIWMGNIALNGDRFDIRIDDVQGTTYVKSNVQIRSDMSLTFTASDRR